MKTETLETNAAKWWNTLSLKQAECLGNKYFHRDYGIVAIDDTTYEEIKFIYDEEMKAKEPQFNNTLSASEINTLIAACLICSVRYTENKNLDEAKRYEDLEMKLRKNCYDNGKGILFV